MTICCQPKKWWVWVESPIPMEGRQRNYGGGSAPAERESKHFLKIILPSAIHATQMVTNKSKHFLFAFSFRSFTSIMHHFACFLLFLDQSLEICLCSVSAQLGTWRKISLIVYTSMHTNVFISKNVFFLLISFLFLFLTVEILCNFFACWTFDADD